MSKSMDKAFDEFKQNWKSDDSLAKQLKKDEKQDKRMRKVTEESLRNTTTEMVKVAESLSRTLMDLRAIQKSVNTDAEMVKEQTKKLIQQNVIMTEWWDKQNDLIHNQMLMMASMGFELELD